MRVSVRIGTPKETACPSADAFKAVLDLYAGVLTGASVQFSDCLAKSARRSTAISSWEGRTRFLRESTR